MGFGSTGNLLYIDLSDGSIRKETMPEDLYRLYPGGKALAAYLLLKILLPAHSRLAQRMCWCWQMAS